MKPGDVPRISPDNHASSHQVLGNVRLSAREMAVLRKRFEKDAGEGIDVPIALLFFGRDETQSTFPESADRPNNADSQNTGMDTENELQYKRRQAQEEDERSASDIEVRLGKLLILLLTVLFFMLPI